MSRYQPIPPVRLPNNYGTIRAVVVWSKPKKSEPLRLGPVRSEAILSPKGQVVSKTWGDDLADYVNLLAVRTLRHGGVDPESLCRLLDTYSREVRIAYHLDTGERTYSDAIVLRFWKNENGQLRCSSDTSRGFPYDLDALAQRLGAITVSIAEKPADSPATDTVSPEISSLMVAPYHLPSPRGRKTQWW